MRIAVCDDQADILEQVKYMLWEIPFVKIVHAHSDMEAFLSTMNGEDIYDAVLMDIDWKAGRTGIDLAEEVYRRSPNTRVIYMTAYTIEYVENAILFLFCKLLSAAFRHPHHCLL